jgi:hypothetical protein
MHNTQEGPTTQVHQMTADELQARLLERVAWLLAPLDAVLDKRLVRTLVRVIVAIVSLRHSQGGLLLSELGGYILSPAQAPAGTKRLSNLLRSPKWSHQLIEQALWRAADERVSALKATGEEALVVWDESVWEKPGSIVSEGLCAVQSSTARWLKRIKPGFYNPPSRPLCVPGLHWLGVLVLGMTGAPQVAAMHWWTNRGERATDKRTEEEHLLHECVRRWGRRVLHVFDRGFAGLPWLSVLVGEEVRFVLRWQKHYLLVDAHGRKRKAWEICRGKRSWDHFRIPDRRSRSLPAHTIGVYATPVTHPNLPHVPLWLIVSRQGKGRQPWYLLTNQPVTDSRQAWHFIRTYARRWQIEMAWRYTKSDLALESPRLWTWERRLKLLLIATLAYDFLLSLLVLDTLRAFLLRHWAHRTGKRCRDASTPLYRLRSAISRLWLAFPPPLHFLLPHENPG